MSQYEAQVFEALYGRRSIRQYQQERPVERKKLVKLLQAAMAAPSACNIQPWEFVVVSEPEGMAGLRATIGDNGDYNAPAAVVVCGYPALIPWEGDEGLADCSAAIENMLTAAAPLGLGTVWIGGFDRTAIRQLLGIPEEAVPLGIVYVGYPAESHAPRTQYREAAVHWQVYDQAREQGKRPGALVEPKP